MAIFAPGNYESVVMSFFDTNSRVTSSSMTTGWTVPLFSTTNSASCAVV
jgi:hypothetical protein